MGLPPNHRNSFDRFSIETHCFGGTMGYRKAPPKVSTTKQPVYLPNFVVNNNTTIATDIYLVGGFNPSETLVSWDDYSQYIWKNKNVPNRQPATDTTSTELTPCF